MASLPRDAARTLGRSGILEPACDPAALDGLSVLTCGFAACGEFFCALSAGRFGIRGPGDWPRDMRAGSASLLWASVAVVPGGGSCGSSSVPHQNALGRGCRNGRSEGTGAR